MAFELPQLPYDKAALEPHIDARTMEIHHGKHHAGYVKKLNAALAGHGKFLDMPVEDLLREVESVPESIRQTVINNGGGHANHSLFWEIMSPDGGGKPGGDLLQAIEKKWGSFDAFQEEFSEKAGSIFGSGWAFLVVDESGSLSCKRHSFQNNPYMFGSTPVMGLDVWEHAYYLNYQNRRADYIEAWWNVVNWSQVSENFSLATG